MIFSISPLTNEGGQESDHGVVPADGRHQRRPVLLPGHPPLQRHPSLGEHAADADRDHFKKIRKKEFKNYVPMRWLLFHVPGLKVVVLVRH